MLCGGALTRYLLRAAGASQRIGSATISSTARTNAGGHGKDEFYENLPRQADDYVPGSDYYAYENPWPKLNKGRLDWLFGDGWRRPLAKDQGQWTRREWICMGSDFYDEYKDWRQSHTFYFQMFCVLFAWVPCFYVLFKPDWPRGMEWIQREAHFELERRRAAGLEPISKDFIDPKELEKFLPSDEDLKNYEIII